MGLRRGAFTCVGWQVKLCDPIWQVTPRSSGAEFRWRAIQRQLFVPPSLSESATVAILSTVCFTFKPGAGKQTNKNMVNISHLCMTLTLFYWQTRQTQSLHMTDQRHCRVVKTSHWTAACLWPGKVRYTCHAYFHSHNNVVCSTHLQSFEFFWFRKRSKVCKTLTIILIVMNR